MDDRVDALVLQVADIVEKRANDRESRRFRVLYAIVAILSFIGIGVVTLLIDVYATRAVDNRLAESRQELDSTKTYTQLLALATQLDMRSSFSTTDRDTIVRLLVRAKDNKQLRAEPAFGALLQKIVRSFSASDNSAFVTEIFDDYKHECLRIPGIVEVLLQHYGRRTLAAVDLSSSVFKEDLARFHLLADAAETFKLKGPAAALRALVAFKIGGMKSDSAQATTLLSYSALDPLQKGLFVQFVEQYSDPKQLAKRVGPEERRISEVGSAFQGVYAKEYAAIAKGKLDDPDISLEEGEDAKPAGGIEDLLKRMGLK